MRGVGKSEQVSTLADGEAPCDVCVCIKSLEQQPVGRYPDLNDHPLML